MNYPSFKPLSLLLFSLIFRNILIIHAQEAMDLKDCINRAQLHNVDIITDNLERQDSWKRLKLQLRVFFPQISLSFSKSDSVTINAADSRINKLGISLNQLLFNGGRNLANYKSALRELELQDLLADDKGHEIAQQLSLQYIGYLKNKEILKIQKQSLNNLDKQIEIAKLEYKLGEITESDLLEISIRGKEYSLNIKDSEEKIVQSRFNLSELMNMSVSDLPYLKGALNLGYQGFYTDKILSDTSYVSELSDKAAEFNKDLKSYYLRELNAQRNLLNSRISWIPKIEAGADLNITGTEYPLNESSFSLALKFSFETPLFPGSLNLNAGKAHGDEHNSSLSTETTVMENLEALIEPSIARNELYSSQLEINSIKRLIDYKVKALSNSITLNYQRCEIGRKKITLASEKLNIQKIRVEMGELTRLDYVKSEIELANHKTELIEAIASLYSNEIELEMTCGIIDDSQGALLKSLIPAEEDH